MEFSIHSDEQYMSYALQEAEKAKEEGEIPVGAVVVCNHRIIARAHNQTERLTDVTAHAEILALTAASNHMGAKYLPGCTLYVTLEPCTMCAGALAWSQIGRIVFGAPDPKRGYERLKENILHPKTEIKRGVLEEKCSSIVKDFFKNLRT
ncbi:MAG: nucleoside deaminase [Cytophagales bacterium]|nr:nucleoside deaminase [Cytophagales bacterium]